MTVSDRDSGSTTEYFLADHLGSTNGLANASGTVTAANSYDSFGNATNSTFPTRYQFTGRETDTMTGLQYNRARWYDPNLGRFISEDPIGFRGGDINVYGYVKNRPLTHRDPRGLDDGDMNPNPFTNNDPSYDWDAYYQRLQSQSNAYWKYRLSLPPKPEEPECGPAGHPFREWLVPDSVGGPWGPFGSKYNLIPPCTAHDSCYSSCNSTKAACDTNLGNDVRDTCLRGGGSPRECNFYGNAYYQGVHRFGDDAYQSAQEEKGCIACSMPTPPDPCSMYGNWACK